MRHSVIFPTPVISSKQGDGPIESISISPIGAPPKHSMKAVIFSSGILNISVTSLSESGISTVISLSYPSEPSVLYLSVSERQVVWFIILTRSPIPSPKLVSATLFASIYCPSPLRVTVISLPYSSVHPFGVKPADVYFATLSSLGPQHPPTVSSSIYMSHELSAVTVNSILNAVPLLTASVLKKTVCHFPASMLLVSVTLPREPTSFIVTVAPDASFGIYIAVAI